MSSGGAFEITIPIDDEPESQGHGRKIRFRVEFAAQANASLAAEERIEPIAGISGHARVSA